MATDPAAEKLKLLGPVIEVPEEQFIKKKLEPAFEELKLAEEVKTMDRAQTKTMLEATVIRTAFKEETKEEIKEEIKDDDWMHFFEEMPKFEEDKEPILIEDAKECVLRFAVQRKQIPTRLRTALKNYTDELTQPERQIYDFYRGDSLTDVTLINPITGATYK